MSRGLFVVFEGPDGVGKSTQAARLADVLDALLTREPGDTPLGGHIRELVLGHDMDPLTEAMLFAADRREHIVEVVRPALEAGRTVVCDRFVDSSLAYQHVGRGLDRDVVETLSEWACEGTIPDVTIVLTGDNRRSGLTDRMEHVVTDDVSSFFAAQAARFPDRYVVVDATGTIEEVHERICIAFDEWVSDFAERN